MYIQINDVSIPFEEDKTPEAIFINVAFAEHLKANWCPEVSCQMDEGSPYVMIPLPLLRRLGITLKPVGTEVLSMADGQESEAYQAKVSMRIKSTNGENISLHDVECYITASGDTVLVGRNVLQIFRKTVVQNKLVELVLCPRTQSFLRLAD